MDEITFSYQVTQEDLTEGNALIRQKLKVTGTWVVAFVGIAAIAVPFLLRTGNRDLNPWQNWFLLPIGLLLVYYGLRFQSSKYTASKYYAATGIAGHEFAARISKEGIQVKGTYSEWKYGWPGILVAEESDKIFALSTGLQVFVFAKRCLTEEQSVALRQLIASQPAFPGGTIPKY